MKQWAFALAIAALALSFANHIQIRQMANYQTLVTKAINQNYDGDEELIRIVGKIAHVIGHITDELEEDKQ